MKWYEQNGTEGDVVISTRIRLARNLRQFPFPASMTEEQKHQADDLIRAAVTDMSAQIGGLVYTDMSTVSPQEAVSMMERHLISPEFAACKPGSGLLSTADESISIMLEEEDHLRLQVLCPGLQLDAAYQMADRIDTALDERLHFAFDERLGYLTQCPTNLGTGMRASIMLHLPALQSRGAVEHLSRTVSKLGLTIRGMYGEGSQSQGAIYQLSNQITLGISETAAVENLRSIATQIIREERAMRESFRDDPQFEDQLYRSLGLLKNVRILSGKEFMKLISVVRMGVSLGMIDDIRLDKINGLICRAQPAALMVAAGKELDASERDAARAKLVREYLQ